MGPSRPTGSWTESLLYDLVVGLGYSMFNRIDGIEEWLSTTPDLTPDDIATRVLEAEGMDPSLNKRQLKQVKVCAAEWLPAVR